MPREYLTKWYVIILFRNFPLGDILLCSLHVSIKHSVFKVALYPNDSSSAQRLNCTSKTVLKLNYIPMHNWLWMIGLLRYLCKSNDWNKHFTCSRGESIISGKMEGPLKHLSKPRPVIFFVLFGENVCANKVCSLSSVLRYSSVSKSPLSLEFYGFSRCHEGTRIAPSDSQSQPPVC